MPIVTADQPLKHKIPLILIYGEPGSSKSSILNTCDDPILMDFDRGAHRTIHRKATLQPESWEEVRTLEKAGDLNRFKTLGIDTAKGALDDFIQPWIISQDNKYSTQKWQLQLYGQMGGEFKRFINSRRLQSTAIMVIAHARKDDDNKLVPDVTGGSGQFLLRIADMVGYVCIKKGKRIIQFEPTEESYGKNCANIPMVEVPPKDSEEFKTFGAWLIKTVSDSLNSMSIEQQAAIEKSQQYHEQIDECTDPAKMNDILAEVETLPAFLKMPLRKLMADKAKALNWKSEKGRGFFVESKKAEGSEQKETAADAKAEEQVEDTTFTATYTDLAELQAAIVKATEREHIESLFFSNGDAIEANPSLQQLFTKMKDSIYGEATVQG